MRENESYKFLILLYVLFLNQPITPVLEEILKPICVDFATQLKNDENSFTSLYFNHLDRVPEINLPEIKIYSNGLKERIKKLYIQTIQSLEP